MSSLTSGMKSWSLGSWNTSWAARRIVEREESVRSSPATVIRPIPRITPTSERSTVLLPAPFAPKRATDSFSETVKLMDSRACLPSGYVRLKSRTSIMVSQVMVPPPIPRLCSSNSQARSEGRWGSAAGGLTGRVCRGNRGIPLPMPLAQLE